jgi:hypothetical protein
MIRSVLFSFALVGTFIPACTGSRASAPPPATDSTTVTSGFVSPSKDEAPACAVTDSVCTNDNDCCSTWCVSGQCEPRPRG